MTWLKSLLQVSSVFATDLDFYPDGIAVHPETGEVLVLSSGGANLYKITPDGSSGSLFASGFGTSPGWHPAPLKFSKDGTTLFMADGPAIVSISGFPAITVLNAPEPSTSLLLGFGALALRMMQRKGMSATCVPQQRVRRKHFHRRF